MYSETRTQSLVVPFFGDSRLVFMSASLLDCSTGACVSKSAFQPDVLKYSRFVLLLYSTKGSAVNCTAFASLLQTRERGSEAISHADDEDHLRVTVGFAKLAAPTAGMRPKLPDRIVDGVTQRLLCWVHTSPDLTELSAVLVRGHGGSRIGLAARHLSLLRHWTHWGAKAVEAAA